MPIQPLACATALAKLDKVQNNVLRLMSGGLKSTPIEAMEVLQGVELLNLRRKKAILRHHEKVLRLEESYSARKQMGMEDLPTTLVKTSFLEQARRLASNYCLPTDRELLPQPGIGMQHIPMSRREVLLELMDETVTKATEPNLLRKAALDTVEAYGSELIRLYTDRSATDATRNAGYGAVIIGPETSKSPESPLLENINMHGPCGIFCSNYDTEATVISKALNMITNQMDEGTVPP